MNKLLKWNIYEITPKDLPITGVMFRGRIRNFCLEKGINVLVENTTDIEDSVRFAVLDSSVVPAIKDYIHTIVNDAQIKLVMEQVPNPVLSKLKVNKEERYTL